MGFDRTDRIGRPDLPSPHPAEIQATSGAFAAIRTDGTVATWGCPRHGGAVPDIVRKQLRDVKKIQANIDTFAAHRGDGI